MAFIALIYIWIHTPNAEEKASHVATLCNVIKQESSTDKTILLNQMQFVYRNRTPSYALHPAKFHDHYATQIIHQYLLLTATQRNQARHQFEQCKVLIQ